MGRYFFHTDGRARFEDEDGTELDCDAAAQIQAARVIAELVRERPEDIWRDQTLSIIVVNDEGRALFRLDLVAVVLSPEA